MWGQCLPTPVGAGQEASPSVEAGGLEASLRSQTQWSPAGDKPAEQRGAGEMGQGRGGGKALATRGLSRSSCPQASGSTAEGRRRGGGYCTVLRQPPLSSPS